MNLIDYPALRSQVTMQQVLDLISYRWLRRLGRTTYGPCPLSCSRYKRCCSFEMERRLWYCHACHRHGNQLDLYAAWISRDLYAAAVDLCERLRIPVPYLAPEAQSRP